MEERERPTGVDSDKSEARIGAGVGGGGIVTGQEDDVILVELIGAIGTSRGARVFGKWRV